MTTGNEDPPGDAVPLREIFGEGGIPTDVHPAFVTRLLQRSREYGATAAALRRELDAALAARGKSVEDAIRSEGRHQAAEQATMANLVGSLRLISSFDWPKSDRSTGTRITPGKPVRILR